MSSFGNFATRAIHSGQNPAKWTHRAVVPPICLSTTFQQFSPGVHAGFDHSRTGNPTRQCLEESIASLESAKYALIFPSGMATVVTITHLLRSGDHILCVDGVCCGPSAHFQTSLAQMGIEVTFADFRDLSNLVNSMKSNTKMVWIETPTNPTMRIIDIEAASNILKDFPGVISVVDNTIMTPYFQAPLKLGADIVMHSLAKYINGHADVGMGALATNDEGLYNKLRGLQSLLGSAPSPFDCMLVNRGLKTLHLRMERHRENAMSIAKFLEHHPHVQKVLYPGLKNHPQHQLAKKQCSGFNGMISFYLKGNFENVKKFISQLTVVTLATSLGSVKTLVDIPSVMSNHFVPEKERLSLGITENLIRLSVGVESISDLLEDLDQALEKAFAE